MSIRAKAVSCSVVWDKRFADDEAGASIYLPPYRALKEVAVHCAARQVKQATI